MPFVKIPDKLPRPKDYLLAGIPRPTTLFARAVPQVGKIADAADFLTMDRVKGRAHTLTVLDEDAKVTGIVSAGSTQYLVAPWTEDNYSGEVLATNRLPSGIVSVELSRATGPRSRYEDPKPVDLGTARAVTLDHSVMLAGMDRVKFGTDDALFVSTALAIELALEYTEQPQASRISTGWHFGDWTRSVPLPVDDLILRIYKHIALAIEPRLHENERLDRTDLLCAATAIVYDSPMYTTKPEAYASVKNGLKVIEYGPVRNKQAARERAAAPPRQILDAVLGARAPAPASPPVNAHASHDEDAAVALQKSYDRGDPFDDKAVVLLERATDIVGALATENAQRSNLIACTAQLVGDLPYDDSPIPREADLALHALGVWGRWPDDASDDVMYDVREDPANVGTRRWYRAYLTMAGLDESVIDAEMSAVASGESPASRDHIEALRDARTS
jgi:hypothetical protein